MQLEVYKTDGSKSGQKVTLSDDVFGIEPNEHSIYRAVRVYLDNQRQGTSDVKTRAEVKGGGKKPFKQKGTGVARQGSSRSPVMSGGGSIFGPEPRDYSSKLPAKMKRLARKSALSYKAKESQIKIVEDFTLGAPKTKELCVILKALQLEGTKTLLLTSKTDINVVRSGRNIPGINVLEADKASTYDLVNNKVLLIQKSALEVLQNMFKN